MHDPQLPNRPAQFRSERGHMYGFNWVTVTLRLLVALGDLGCFIPPGEVTLRDEWDSDGTPRSSAGWTYATMVRNVEGSGGSPNRRTDYRR
jgi:hypothetical protein